MQEAEIYYQRAENNFYQGEYEDGFKNIDEAIRFDPDNIRYLWFRAEKLFDQSQIHDLEHLRGEIEHIDSEIISRARKAISSIITILEAKDVEDEYLKYVIQNAYQKRIILNHRTDASVNEIIEDLTRLIEYDMADVDTYHTRAKLYRDIGNYEKALEDLLYVEKRSPDNLRTQNDLIRIHYCLGNYESAINAASKVIKDGLGRLFGTPDIYLAHHYRGKSHFRLGNKKKALADFNEALRLFGKDNVENPQEYMNIYGTNYECD